MAEQETRSGEIRFLHPEKGFGFLRDNESQEDIYFHCCEVLNIDFEELERFDEVEYYLKVEKRGRHEGRDKAADIVVIKQNGGKKI